MNLTRHPPPYEPDGSPVTAANANEVPPARSPSQNTLRPSPSPSKTKEVYDILPSFQMYQAILKRNEHQFTENLVEKPPQYETEGTDAAASGYTPPHEATNPLDEYAAFDHQETQEDIELHNDNVAVLHEAYGSSIVDNIDRVPKELSLPFDIQIFVTKDIPEPYTDNELETRLKHYTLGDLVNGYLVVTNTTAQPQTFGLFTVLLEGLIKITEPAPAGEPAKYHKILMKKFLRMYDLHALYGYIQVPNLAGIEYPPHTRDTHDGTIIALPETRVLQPHTKYKKFFTFRFPSRLLDNVCPTQLEPHIAAPPLFGIDHTGFNNKAGGIKVNKVLGYGHLDVRGTPLLTKDFGWDNVSISYTIEAKFIDRKHAALVPFLQHDIDDPEQYVILKQAQYFLRFVPTAPEPLPETLTALPTSEAIAAQFAAIEHDINRQLAHISGEVKDKHLFDGTDALATPKPLMKPRPVVVLAPVAVLSKRGLLKLVAKVGTCQAAVTQVPARLSYSLPTLLMRYNHDTVAPLALEVELTFTGVEGRKPPAVASVEVNMVAWSYCLDFPVPFAISGDFFAAGDQGLAHLQKRAQAYQGFIDANPGLKVSRATRGFLKLARTLRAKRDVIGGYFQPWTPLAPDKWASDGGHARFRATVPLVVINKANVNVIPSFQTCLVGRSYCLQVVVRLKGDGDAMVCEVPVTVGYSPQPA